MPVMRSGWETVNEQECGLMLLCWGMVYVGVGETRGCNGVYAVREERIHLEQRIGLNWEAEWDRAQLSGGILFKDDDS